MTILSILKFPHPVLRAPASPVSAVTPELRTLAADMTDTMRNAHGVGLAAPQVGHSLRLIVADNSAGGTHIFFNPEITIVTKSLTGRDEGCLSLPGITAIVRRPTLISISGMNADGEICRIDNAEGLLAACLQHEIDHLNGVLFIDHLSWLKRGRMLAKYDKLLKEE